MDLFNKATKLVDHNRGAFVGIIALGACIYAAGCSAWDGKTISQQSGELVNQEQRQGEYVLAKKQLGADAVELRDRINADLAKLERLEREGEQLDAEYSEDIDTMRDEIDARTDGILMIAQEAVKAAPQLAFALPWVGLGSTLLTGGMAYDNRRKDKKLNETKAERDELKAKVAAQ